MFLVICGIVSMKITRWSMFLDFPRHMPMKILNCMRYFNLGAFWEFFWLLTRFIYCIVFLSQIMYVSTAYSNVRILFYSETVKNHLLINVGDVSNIVIRNAKASSSVHQWAVIVFTEAQLRYNQDYENYIYFHVKQFPVLADFPRMSQRMQLKGEPNLGWIFSSRYFLQHSTTAVCEYV